MRRRTKVFGGISAIVCILAFAAPALGGCFVAGLILWIASVMKNPTGSFFVARMSGDPSPTKSQHLLGVTVAMCGIVVVAGFVIAGAKVESARGEHHAAELRASEQKKVDDENATLRASAPTAVAKATAIMAAASSALEAGEVFDTQNGANQAKELLAKYDTLSPSIPEVTVLEEQIQSVAGQLTTITSVKTALDDAVEMREAQADIKDGDYVAADKIFAALLTALDVPSWAAKFVSMDNVKKIRATVTSKRRAIASRLQKQQLQEGAALVYQKICGEKPLRSGWDHAIVGLESHIKDTANDPDSIDVKDCTIPGMTQKHCWVSTCKVWGKNGFGAKILLLKTYSFSTLGIEEVGGDAE